MFMLLFAVTGVIAQNARGLQLTANVSESGCAANPHVIVVEANGGKAPYIYNWNDGQTGRLRKDLKGGTYICTVRDSEGKVIKKQIVLPQLPTELTANLHQEKTGSTTSITIQASGGKAPYQYFWFGEGLDPKSSSLTKQTVMSAGSYMVVVRDKNGCSVSHSLTVK